MIAKKKLTQGESTGPRRSPGADRQRDAERSRRLLMDAALDEFAAKGLAGARTQDIADRAGVNKQLITYYFGGKEGLYRALGEHWFELEREFTKPGMSFDKVIEAYMHNTDPRMARILVWEGLRPIRTAEEDLAAGDEGVAELQARQQAGEIAADLDPRYIMLAIMGAMLAPTFMPQIARRVTGVDPESAEFKQEYIEFLQQLVGRLK